MKEYLPHQLRVIEEKHELDWKLGKLKIYLSSAHFATLLHIDQTQLNNQFEAMSVYSKILGSRIKRFDLPTA